MSRFILTEEDKRYIQSLYNINEQNEKRSVLDIQNELKEKGFDPGPLDGKWGPKTAKACLAYLNREKVDVDSTQTASDSAEKQDEVEIDKKDRENENKKPEEVQKEASRLTNMIRSAKEQKKKTRKPCRELVGNARTLRNQGITFQESTMNKDILSYCLNTYRKRGEGELRDWAGIPPQ